MIYAFDLDGTLCTSTYGDYEKAYPLLDRIDRVNELYDQGHTIKIFTARGMRRFNGDAIKCYKELYVLTKNQLDYWGVKYHDIILGKPEYDKIIDDKGINDNDFFKD